MEFDWDEHNLSHIAIHVVSRDQVESALRDKPLFIRDEVRQGEHRRNYVGRASDAIILMDHEVRQDTLRYGLSC